MIPQLEKLSAGEQHVLLNAPVWISVLASCRDKQVNKAQKEDAIQLAHFKTFTAHPMLLSFYRQVEKNFIGELDQAIEEYYPFDEASVSRLKAKLSHVNAIASKLDRQYAELLLKSFEKYERHVKRAGHSVFEDFIFPIPISGLTR
jgi:hypothetical protein